MANTQLVFTSYDGPKHEAIYRMLSDGTVHKITNHALSCYMPSLSADGSKVAFAGEVAAPAKKGDKTQIFLCNIDGSGEKQLTTTGSNYSPAFSPDGKLIIYHSWRGTHSRLFTIVVDGGVEQQLPDTTNDGAKGQFSPDGKKILFATDVVGIPHQVYSVDLDGTHLQRLSPQAGSGTDPCYSPDGVHIAFIQNEQIWLMNADGSAAKQLTTGDKSASHPCFSPTGPHIIYQYGATHASRIYEVQLDGSKQHDIYPNGPDGWFPCWGFAPHQSLDR